MNMALISLSNIFFLRNSQSSNILTMFTMQKLFIYRFTIFFYRHLNNKLTINISVSDTMDKICKT